MAIQNGFFKSINGDRRYLAEFFTSYFASFIGNGVFPNPSTNLQVINNQNFSTIVRPGKGWINGHYLNNDDNIVINHQPPDGVLRRIDRIVFSVNLDSRSMDIYLKQGTPSSEAVAPSLIRNSTLYELALADVAFNPGATSISQSNITDQRMNKALCGIVHGVVEQLDTTTLFNQYQQFLVDKGVEFDQQLAVNQQTFDDWFAQLNDILEGDVAANLANMIITHTNNATPQKHIEVVSAIPQDLANKGLLLVADDLDNPNNPPEIPTSIVLNERIDEFNEQLEQNQIEIKEIIKNVIRTPESYINSTSVRKGHIAENFVDVRLDKLPGESKILAGDAVNGFMGFVKPSEFGKFSNGSDFNGSILASRVGLTAGIAQNNDVNWLKFAWKESVIYIPQKNIRQGINWDHLYNAGVVYSDNYVGFLPVDGIMGSLNKRLQVDVSTNRIICDNLFKYPDHVVAEVGDRIVLRGFLYNNGEYTVSNITNDYIQVTEPLIRNELGELRTARIHSKRKEVLQNAQVVLDGITYQVRLMHGSNNIVINELTQEMDVVGDNNEWNKLLLGLHIGNKIGFQNPRFLGDDVEDFGYYLDFWDLNMDYLADVSRDTGFGSHTWLQSVLVGSNFGSTPYRTNRSGGNGYNTDGSAFHGHKAWDITRDMGWRPVLVPVIESIRDEEAERIHDFDSIIIKPPTNPGHDYH